MVTVNSQTGKDIKKVHGIPTLLQSCHTAKIEDYFVEGHVPAEDIARMITEKPDIKGLIVPGMPIGSPGMEQGEPEHYQVLALDASGLTSVYAEH
jgi:hypothetical protein